MTPRACEECGATFTPKIWSQRTCGAKACQRAWIAHRFVTTVKAALYHRRPLVKDRRSAVPRMPTCVACGERLVFGTQDGVTFEWCPECQLEKPTVRIRPS